MSSRPRSRTWALCTDHEGKNWHLAGKSCPHCAGITNSDWDMCGDCALVRGVCQVCSVVLKDAELILARSDRWADPSSDGEQSG